MVKNELNRKRDEKTGMKESRGACNGGERLDYTARAWTRVFLWQHQALLNGKTPVHSATASLLKGGNKKNQKNQENLEIQENQENQEKENMFCSYSSVDEGFGCQVTASWFRREQLWICGCCYNTCAGVITLASGRCLLGTSCSSFIFMWCLEHWAHIPA